MSDLLSDMEWHVLNYAGIDDWAKVPIKYWRNSQLPGHGSWVPYTGLRPAVRRMVALGYIHARIASYSPIGRYSDRRLAPEPYPDFDLVQTQAIRTEQGKDLATLVLVK